MGGLGPGIGGFELLVIGLVALIVVGPKDLPLLMRKVGRVMARARAMASEFRASFDEMARQSELDELRKEVEALRRGQGLVPLGPEAEATFRDIQDDLQRPLPAPAAPIAAPTSASLAQPPAPVPSDAATAPAAAPAPEPVAAPKAKRTRTPKPTAAGETPPAGAAPARRRRSSPGS